MRQLVCERGVIVVEAAEQTRRWHCHAISGWLVIGLIALVTQVDGDGGEKGVERQLTSFRLD